MKDLKEKIIELARKVYKELGPFGFIEELKYEVALAYEFRKNGLKYLEQLQVDIMYDNQIVKEGKVDFIVFDEKEENGILVELKAKDNITGEYLHQLFTYYEAITSGRGGFPKFISERIRGGLILNWKLDKGELLKNFKEFFDSRKVSVEDIMGKYKQKCEQGFNLFIVDILLDKDGSKGEEVEGDAGEKREEKRRKKS